MRTPFGSMKYIDTSPEVYLPDHHNRRLPRPGVGAALPSGRGYREGAMLHAADVIPIGWFLFTLWNFEIGEQAVISHIKEIMPDFLVKADFPVSRPDTDTGRDLHSMYQWHADNIDEKSVVICISSVVSAR